MGNVAKLILTVKVAIANLEAVEPFTVVILPTIGNDKRNLLHRVVQLAVLGNAVGF